MRAPQPEARAELAGLVLYVAGVVGFAYGIAEHQPAYGNEAASVVVLLGLAVVQCSSAFLIGRWWALLLPALAILIAVPAGYPADARGEPLPTWFSLVVFSPVAIVLAGIGILARRWWNRRRQPATPAAGA